MSHIHFNLCSALIAAAACGTLVTSESFNRFTPMHIGVDVQGYGGVFRIDSTSVVADYRFTAQSSSSIDGVWLFWRTVGQPGAVRLTLRPGQAADPTQPDLSTQLSVGVATPQAASATPQWQHVSMTPIAGASFAAGDVLHLILKPVSTGNFGGPDYIEIVTSRARAPLQDLPSSLSTPELTSRRDDAFAFLYASNAVTPLDARVQRDNNAAFLPIFAVETAAGELYGQPCDTHIEKNIFDDYGYGQTVRFSGPFTFDYVAMFVRGAGQTGPGTPADHLYIDVYECDLVTGVVRSASPQQELANKGDKLFKSRSHWWGRFIDPPVTLTGGPTKEYWLILSSRGSQGGGDDAWIYSAEASNLGSHVPGPVPSFGMHESRAISVYVPALNPAGSEPGDVWPITDLGPNADAAFHLAYFGNQGPTAIGILDEALAKTVDSSGNVTFPLSAFSGDTVQFDVLARDVGIATVTGASLFARFVDRSTGALVGGSISYPGMPANYELVDSTSFVMPAHDLHLWLEVGHIDVVGGTGAVVDDVTPWEIRLK